VILLQFFAPEFRRPIRYPFVLHLSIFSGTKKKKKKKKKKEGKSATD
jgi:hypothetical protein